MTSKRKTDGSDVFADLGLAMSDDDMLKVHIARAITRIVQSGSYKQSEAAEIMGLDQPKVSKLLRGRLSEFKSGRLLQCLLQLGYDFEFKIRKSSSRRGQIKYAA